MVLKKFPFHGDSALTTWRKEGLYNVSLPSTPLDIHRVKVGYLNERFDRTAEAVKFSGNMLRVIDESLIVPKSGIIVPPETNLAFLCFEGEPLDVLKYLAEGELTISEKRYPHAGGRVCVAFEQLQCKS